MPKEKIDLSGIPPELQRNWGWLLGLGILFVFLGCVGMGMVTGLTLVSVLFIGVLLLVAGITQIIDGFYSKEWKGAAWHALIALLYLIAGGIVIYDPILASTAITALIAWVLIFIGITRLFMAGVLRDAAGWGWLVLAGISAIILGVLILVQWPLSGIWVIGLFIAIELLVMGWTYIFIAFASRGH